MTCVKAFEYAKHVDWEFICKFQTAYITINILARRST